MDHYQLTRFEIKDAGDNNVVVLVTGPLRYKAILQRAFNQHYFSRTFEDRFGRYEWGTYIYGIGSSPLLWTTIRRWLRLGAMPAPVLAPRSIGPNLTGATSHQHGDRSLRRLWNG